MAGQITRLKGASRVIGSAGSPKKVAHLTGRLGFDYRDGPVLERLAPRRAMVPVAARSPETTLA
ncbi:hypothetical protein ABZV46_47050, partial [Streptomyces sp. NPDC005209]